MKLFNLVIDPGHGGTDTGATTGDLHEKDINLDLGLKLRHMVEKFGLPWDVYMTRVDDMTITQSKRGAYSKSVNADLVLSIHVNSFTDPDTNGAMVFHWPDNEFGKEVADSISLAIPKTLRRMSNQGRVERSREATKELWPRVRYVLSKHQAATILVETGFITSSWDRSALLNKAVQTQLICAMLIGVGRAWEILNTAKRRIEQ